MERISKPLSDRIFYTVYRFFEEVHGRGDAAEVAAIFTWCFLLLMNIVAALILLFVLIGRPVIRDNVLTYVFGGIGVLISVTQYLRYLGGDRLQTLHKAFGEEAAIERSRRRWATFGYSTASVLVLAISLVLLSK